MIRFAILGGGWRAAFFLRIARALPDQFEVSGVLVRDSAKACAFAAKWGVPVVGTMDELAKLSSDFVVLSVPRSEHVAILTELARRKIAVLCETPPAPDVAGMSELFALHQRGARIQIAEQYPFQPLHAARIALVRSGRLGRVSHAQVSAAHGYHGIGLLRQFMGLGFDDARITAMSFKTPIVAGPDRSGPPTHEHVIDAGQEIAWLTFGDRVGIVDFTGMQYFSWIRSARVLVRGERGEINNHDVRYLRDFATPVHLTLQRETAGAEGNLEGFYLKGILAGEQWLYRNPVAPGRLSDDEIAVATCLQKMAEYVQGGQGFYDLPSACQDHYLSLMIAQAAASGAPVQTQRQCWAS